MAGTVIYSSINTSRATSFAIQGAICSPRTLLEAKGTRCDLARAYAVLNAITNYSLGLNEILTLDLRDKFTMSR